MTTANGYRTKRPMEQDRIEQRGDNSWWVLRSPIDHYGEALPASRVVHFAESEAAAKTWLERQGQAMRIRSPHSQVS